MGWLLALGLKECLVKCATVCVKSVVILFYSYQVQVYSSEDNFCAVVRKPKLKDSKLCVMKNLKYIPPLKCPICDKRY